MWSRRTMLVATSCALARAVAAEPGVRRVALEISDYPLVFAAVRVNGNSVRALIDTGSSSPVRLSTRLAQDLKLVLRLDPGSTAQGLGGRRFTVQRGTADTLAIGDSMDRNMAIEVAADRIESISAQVGTAFDVILGWGFLSRYNFMLDYRKRVLQFSDGPLQPDVMDDSIPYTVVNRLPVVSARWSGHEVRLLLDTGAPMCNIDAEFARTPAGQIVSGDLVLGTRRLALEWRAKDLSVTGKALGTVGTLGNNLFGQYRVYFDVRKQTMLLD